MALPMSECARKASESNEDIMENISHVRKEKWRETGIMTQTTVPKNLRKEYMTKLGFTLKQWEIRKDWFACCVLKCWQIK